MGNWSGTFTGDLTNPSPIMKIGLVFLKAQKEIWVNWAWSYLGWMDSVIPDQSAAQAQNTLKQPKNDASKGSGLVYSVEIPLYFLLNKLVLLTIFTPILLSHYPLFEYCAPFFLSYPFPWASCPIYIDECVTKITSLPSLVPRSSVCFWGEGVQSYPCLPTTIGIFGIRNPWKHIEVFLRDGQWSDTCQWALFCRTTGTKWSGICWLQSIGNEIYLAILGFSY